MPLYNLRYIQEDLADKVNSFAAKMKRGYFYRHVLRANGHLELITEPSRASSKRRRYRKPPKPAEVISICHEVFVQKLHYSDVARNHNMTVAAIA